MLNSQPVIYCEQRMGKSINDLFLVKIFDELKDIIPQNRNILVLLFSYIVSQDMEFATVLRKICGDLFT